jgi:hypothetical protein
MEGVDLDVFEGVDVGGGANVDGGTTREGGGGGALPLWWRLPAWSRSES